MSDRNEITPVSETQWLKKYRMLVHRIIYLCNASATRFSVPQYYKTEYKLTGTQLQVIEYALEGRDDKMAVIADRLGITRGAFSSNVKALTEMGLMYKEHREGNKKDYYLVVTEKGKEEYRKYAECVYERCLRDVFDIADSIPEEYIEKFEQLLKIYGERLV